MAIGEEFKKLPLTDSPLDPLLKLESSPVLWPPARVGAMSSWWGHVPFAHWFVTSLKPHSIVELGTHNGVSFSAFCEAVQRGGLACRCYAVDTWQGDEHAGLYGEQIFTDLQPFIALRFGAFAELMRMTFEDAAPYFTDGFIDLLHIDGLHTYDTVKSDFLTWLPKMSERGIVLFHDINVRERGFGVWQLWEELRSRYPSFEFLHGHGLGMIAVGSDIPPAMQVLCNLEPGDAQTVRDLFSQIGGRWVSADLAQRNASRIQELTAQHEQIGQLNHQIEHLNNRLIELHGAHESVLQSQDQLTRQIALRDTWLASSFKKNFWESLHRARLPRTWASGVGHVGEDGLTGVHPTPAPSKKVRVRGLRGKLSRLYRKIAAKARKSAASMKMASKARAVDPWRLGTGLEGLSDAEINRVKTAFDEEFYFTNYPDVKASGMRGFGHYMLYGWREGRDPQPSFVTSYYLSRWTDIRDAGINPFVHWILHGIDEGRRALPFSKLLEQLDYRPRISAIIPNYNHARFLPQRIESILAQSYENIEIIILDDCSTDDSRDIIEFYCEAYPSRIRSILNEENSGGVFRQWRKGVEASAGDLVWLCESDDFCEPNFLENLYPHFRDMSVMIAFGCIHYVDQDGNSMDGLDRYREGAEPGIWNQRLVRPAAEWFANGFGVNNVIANVGGCLFRRFDIRADVWEEAQKYRVAGDWFLYAEIAGGGQIAWEPNAVSYFRRHGNNTSSKAFTTPAFYSELERFMIQLRSRWNIPIGTVDLFYDKLYSQYAELDVADTYGDISKYCSYSKIIKQERTSFHILISFYGFIPGGGEFFPINLANALYDQGWTVSMLGFDLTQINSNMRDQLNSAIAVYSAEWVSDYGADRFLREAGVSLVHSHTIGSEFRFFDIWDVKQRVPYLVTLHGSYEVSDLSTERLHQLAARVDHFVYTAEKNRHAIDGIDLPPAQLTKLPNAMPMDERPFPLTRAQLRISDDAVVFTLVARGIPSKGWEACIKAFEQLRIAHSERPLHLLLCGEGDEVDRLRALHGSDQNITFLGYQSHIHGLYSLSDVALVPSRFPGESFPLCIIQALQSGCPVIGSRIGEIENMLAPEGMRPGGLIIPIEIDDEIFIRNLADAMAILLDNDVRRLHSKSAKKLGEVYNMANLARVYGDLYKRMLNQN